MSVGPLSAVSPSVMCRHSALESPGEHIKILDLGDESLETTLSFGKQCSPIELSAVMAMFCYLCCLAQ